MLPRNNEWGWKRKLDIWFEWIGDFGHWEGMDPWSSMLLFCNLEDFSLTCITIPALMTYLWNVAGWGSGKVQNGWWKWWREARGLKCWDCGQVQWVQVLPRDPDIKLKWLLHSFIALYIQIGKYMIRSH
jgi:hypothetical protein